MIPSFQDSLYSCISKVPRIYILESNKYIYYLIGQRDIARIYRHIYNYTDLEKEIYMLFVFFFHENIH